VRAAIRATRRGEHNAFARVVELYERRLFGLALMMIHDRAGAEDVVQEAFGSPPSRYGWHRIGSAVTVEPLPATVQRFQRRPMRIPDPTCSVS
jgi:hypothetical protein